MESNKYTQLVIDTDKCKAFRMSLEVDGKGTILVTVKDGTVTMMMPKHLIASDAEANAVAAEREVAT